MLLTYLALIATGNGFNLTAGAYFCYLPDLVTLTTSFENKDRDKILNAIMTCSLILNSKEVEILKEFLDAYNKMDSILH